MIYLIVYFFEAPHSLVKTGSGDITAKQCPKGSSDLQPFLTNTAAGGYYCSTEDFLFMEELLELRY